MNKNKSQITRFLESLGLDNTERFDMELIVKKDITKPDYFRLNFIKEVPWEYDLLMEFIGALENMSFNAELHFSYTQKPDFEDVSNLFEEFILTKYHAPEVPTMVFEKGKCLISKDEFSDYDAVDDFNDLIKFISYGFEAMITDELLPDNGVSIDTSLIKEITPEEPKEEFLEETEEEFFEELDESVIEHKREMAEVFSEFKNSEHALEVEEDQKRNKAKIYRKGNYFELETIDDIYDMTSGSNFSITGTVYGYENRMIKNGTKLMATFVLADDNNAISVRAVESGEELTKEKISSIKNGDVLFVKGAYSKEIKQGQTEEQIQLYAHFVEKLPAKPLRNDPSLEKRVELHLHSKMSAMDGLGDMKDYVKLAKNMGMKALAITDHGVLQSFPEAERVTAEINKGVTDEKDKFKMIYGIEFYAFNQPLYGWNYVDTPLHKARYCVFDFETTGLSRKYDKATEFGAVLIEDGRVVERKDFFINAGVHIPLAIQKKTKITDEMIKDGLSEKEAALEIEKFAEGCILVSHNASFDVGFINSLRKAAGLPPDNHPVIDTLALSHYLFPNAAKHKLGALSRNLKLDVYDEEAAHRADFDAEALNAVWQAIIPLLEKDGCRTHRDLASLTCKDKKMYKHLKAQHLIALAKNQEGLKALFRLVSLSETKYMALGSVPKIPYEEIEKERENLLIGSACFNGDVFQKAMLESDEDLEEAMKFYDYIEVQPRNNYSWLIHMGEIEEERLSSVLNSIVSTADKLGKMICATGDVHYVNPEDKITRDVYICSKALGGGFHPLWSNRRENYMSPFPNPDQHFRSTYEMMEEFSSWLGEEKAFEIVVENTNKIADQIEHISVLKTKLYTPDANLPGSKEKLEEICWGNLKKRYDIDRETEYEEGSPKAIIKSRLIQELNGIINNGYSVTYYIAHLLVKKAADDGFFVGSRGSVGSSFAAHMADITEVNPLAPHYLCPKCKHLEWAEDKTIKSGYDLEEKNCPHCGEKMERAGQSIPFQTFLGFNAEKVPDIDLNFDADYQPRAHAYTRELLSSEEENKLYRAGKTVESPHVIRAGTISCSEEKNAIGYVKGYYERVLHKTVTNQDNAFIRCLASRCTGVKKTTGQHPGGIVVIPADMDIYDFTPYQYPADDESVGWLTTHFEFASMHDCVLKLDELGHVDPLALRKMKEITGIDFKTLPMNDAKVLSLFTTNEALEFKQVGNDETWDFICNEFKTGSIAIPEFGTQFVQGLIKKAKPKTFDDLLIISGLSHGTNVWNNNAEDLIMNKGLELKDVIGCRDDIMNYLIGKGVDNSLAFKMMEDVRKGKFPGTQSKYLPALKEANIPDWYIDSCLKIQYLFPRAHATAYVMEAVRVAWYKIYQPAAFYAVYLGTRCDSYDIKAMTSPIDEMVLALKDYKTRKDRRLTNASDEEKIKALLAACELTARGMRIGKVDLMKSDSEAWTISEDGKTIIPPFKSIPNFALKAALSIEEARKDGEFISIEDLKTRSNLGDSAIQSLRDVGSLDGLNESNQLDLFSFSF